MGYYHMLRQPVKRYREGNQSSFLLTHGYKQVVTVYKLKSQVAGIEKTLNNYPDFKKRLSIDMRLEHLMMCVCYTWVRDPATNKLIF